MSLRLPALTSPVRKLFDVEYLAELAEPSRRRSMLTFREAVGSGRNTLANEFAARSVTLFCLRADGNIWLIEVTRKTWRKVWDFGQ